MVTLSYIRSRLSVISVNVWPAGTCRLSSEIVCMCCCFQRRKQSGDASWTFLELKHNPELPLTPACRELSLFLVHERHKTISCWWLFKDNSSISETWGLNKSVSCGDSTILGLSFFPPNLLLSVGSVRQPVYTDTHVHVQHVMWRHRRMCMKEKLRQHTSKHISKQLYVPTYTHVHMHTVWSSPWLPSL